MEEAFKSEIEVPGHRYSLIRPVKKENLEGQAKKKWSMVSVLWKQNRQVARCKM